jgi:glyoxylase-like metal-dependent hydrolase (beta-lactamase superfamily II)
MVGLNDVNQALAHLKEIAKRRTLDERPQLRDRSFRRSQASFGGETLMLAPLPIAERWFAHDEIESGIQRWYEPHCCWLMRANIFLIKGTTHDLLVDSGTGVSKLRPTIAPYLDKPLIIFTTHTHRDHIGGHHEFPDSEILVHPLEAGLLRKPIRAVLHFDKYSEEHKARLRERGLDTTGALIDALPYAGYDLDAYQVIGVEPTRLVDEGDIVDIGSRQFEVFHVAGHSPGSIALWEPATRMLISGDAMYDNEPISDQSPGSSIPTYIETMERFKTIPARIIHGGHRLSFDAERMIAICDEYLLKRRVGKPQ